MVREHDGISRGQGEVVIFTLAGVGVNLVPRVLSYKQREPGNEVGQELRPLRSKHVLRDPGAATILVKNLETLPQF